MTKRVSHSLLDPWLTTPLKSLYRWLPIPQSLPPEAIVIAGHLLAIVAAVGFAYSTSHWWGGIGVACGVAGNHLADCLDGTHARATGQCRNGGELLDHFFDPLSFSYWLVGLAISCQRLDLGLVAVIGLYATANLTNIRAKMIGEFTLARFGPTEFKTLLVGYGLLLSFLQTKTVGGLQPQTVALVFFSSLIVIGLTQLVLQLVTSVGRVNRDGAPPDNSEWITRKSVPDGQPGDQA